MYIDDLFEALRIQQNALRTCQNTIEAIECQIRSYLLDPHKNIYESLEEAHIELEEKLLETAHKDQLALVYNNQYTEFFCVNGKIYKAILDIDYQTKTQQIIIQSTTKFNIVE